MSEHHRRCRFYPYCRVHVGIPRPRAFSAANRTEMREMRADGWSLVEIAQAFETTHHYVSSVTRRKPV